MKPIKSAVSFFRQQLGFKGKTEHNGRGVYEMYFSDPDMTPYDAILRARVLIDKWHKQNIIETVTEDDRSLQIVIKAECFDLPGYLQEPDMADIAKLWKETYRTLYINKQHMAVGVLFSC